MVSANTLACRATDLALEGDEALAGAVLVVALWLIPEGVEPSAKRGSAFLRLHTKRSLRHTQERCSALGVEIRCCGGQQRRVGGVDDVVSLLDAVRASHIGRKVRSLGRKANDVGKAEASRGTLDIIERLRDAVRVPAVIKHEAQEYK